MKTAPESLRPAAGERAIRARHARRAAGEIAAIAAVAVIAIVALAFALKRFVLPAAAVGVAGLFAWKAWNRNMGLAEFEIADARRRDKEERELQESERLASMSDEERRVERLARREEALRRVEERNRLVPPRD